MGLTKKKEVKEEWIPISQFRGEDFDEATQKYLGAQCLMELQQNSITKVIRTIKIGD